MVLLTMILGQSRSILNISVQIMKIFHWRIQNIKSTLQCLLSNGVYDIFRGLLITEFYSSWIKILSFIDFSAGKHKPEFCLFFCSRLNPIHIANIVYEFSNRLVHLCEWFLFNLSCLQGQPLPDTCYTNRLNSYTTHTHMQIKMYMDINKRVDISNLCRSNFMFEGIGLKY